MQTGGRKTQSLGVLLARGLLLHCRKETQIYDSKMLISKTDNTDDPKCVIFEALT